MLVFDYKCGCGHTQEKFVKKSDDEVECPECGATMSKMPSGSHYNLYSLGCNISGTKVNKQVGLPKLGSK